jgi:DNA repair photolyase
VIEDNFVPEIDVRENELLDNNRYHPISLIDVDEGWSRDEALPTVPTKLIPEQSKTIISSNKSPDIPFNKSINPYRGCEHGCVYCYARPTHAYWDMSPGLDFETKIIVRTNAAPLLEQSFNKPRYQCEPICIGSNTDPYQPTERSERITRSVLEVLQRYRHSFSIITKGELILRDIDILTNMAKGNLCSVAVSLTTLNNETKRKLEPRTASPAARLKVIEQLSKAGVNVTVLAAPIIPVVNDHELEDILTAASNVSAKSAAYIFLRLPLEIDTLFTEWLQQHYPDRVDHVLSIMRQSRGGKTYESQFHTRMKGRGVFADLLHQRFQPATRKHGFNIDSSRNHLDMTRFRKQNEQLSLF